MLFEHATNKKSIENAERLELKVLRQECVGVIVAPSWIKNVRRASPLTHFVQPYWFKVHPLFPA